MFDLIVVGGGASGFYSAIHAAQGDPKLKIAILERGKEVLSKVKVSGGGRCNVAHGEFDPRELVKNYPRGEKELLGSFHRYCTGNTVSFFEENGVPLKVESDGRMFPTTDSSQTIIDLFLHLAKKSGIKILKHSGVSEFYQVTTEKGNFWKVHTIKKTYLAKKMLIATGSSPKIWNLLGKLGHSIVAPVPSLFTFNIKDQRLNGIQGVSARARVKVFDKNMPHKKITIKLKSQIAKPLLISEGPVLITHWGLSGPAILKLSAWGARLFNEYKYRFSIHINWLPDYYPEAVFLQLMEIKQIEAKKTIARTKVFDLPKRLWTRLVKASKILDNEKWADVTKEELHTLVDQLTKCEFRVEGKSTFKEEFVTAGGVELGEIDFKTMESKICPDLFFAGEVINVDAVTGGFNFQNAWTTGFIAAQGILQK